MVGKIIIKKIKRRNVSFQSWSKEFGLFTPQPRLHRIDGPAMIYGNDDYDNQYYLNGKCLSYESWLDARFVIGFGQRTQIRFLV